MAELPAWDVRLRTIHLLVENIDRPLSVDRSVWPTSKNELLHIKLFNNSYPGPNSAPNGLRVYNLKDISLTDLPSQHENSFLIGLSVYQMAFGQIIDMHGIQKEALSIEHVEEHGWTCIGYDVADRWLVSGLVNCGYILEDKNILSKRYADRLNKSGLFKEMKDAHRFRQEIDPRIPEHSPFYVFGIWSSGEPR